MALTKEELVPYLSEIANKVHTHPTKKKLRFHHDSIAMACPYCGDSAINPREKRGHLFIDSLKFFCYNEGCRSDIVKLCKDFSIDLDPEIRLDLGQIIENNRKFVKKSIIDFSEITILFNLEDVIEFYQNNEHISHLKKVEADSSVGQYLINRRIDYTHPMFYQGYNRNNLPILVIINIFGDKVCSMQTRTIGKGREYRVIVWSEIKKMIYPDMKIDDSEQHMYDHLSLFFGLSYVNPNLEVNIFEGFLDATLAPNSIGLTGLQVDTTPLEENGFNIRYFLDNPFCDKAARIPTEKLIRQNKKVFLWKRMIQEIISKSKDPYKLEKILKETKDLNDLEKIGKNFWFRFKLENYFSIDEMDILYLEEL